MKTRRKKKMERKTHRKRNEVVRKKKTERNMKVERKRRRGRWTGKLRRTGRGIMWRGR